MRQPWQERALYYYDNIGELRFAAQFYAQMLSRIRIFPATVTENGKLEEIKSGTPVELLDQIQDPGGGRERLQYDYGRMMMVTGEGALFGTGLESDEEKWRFLWVEELKQESGDTLAIRKRPDGSLTSEQGVAYRMWTPHPRWTDWADSPFRSILDIAEELLILTAAVRSTAVTRLTNGILAVPTEIAPIGDEDQNMDEDPKRNPFLQKFVEHLNAQIENPGSAEARVPFYVEGGYEYLDRLRWIATHDPQTDYLEKELRVEAIKRFAISLDFPPETLLGMTDANHWTAQQVQHDKWRIHGIPMADQFVTDLNDVYLRPGIIKAGDDARDVVIGYDDSQVVVSPDLTAIADEAMDRMAISFAGYRQLKGISEDMAPSEDEQKLVAGVKMRDPVVAGLEEAAPAVRGPQAAPAVNQAGQSNVPAQPTNGRVVSRQEAMRASVEGAAVMGLRQCRSKAGARLRSNADVQVCPECQRAIDGLPNGLVASALGLEQLAKMDPINLVRGGTDDFKGCLEEWGVAGSNADVLCERLEAYAAKTLFEPNTPELPHGFASHIEHALEAAERAMEAA